MFGLFDNFDPEDPRKLGLLMAGLAAIQGAPNSRKNIGADLAHAGLMGLQGYSQATSMKDKRAEEKQQREMRAMQMEEMRRANAAHQGLLGAAERAYAPAQTFQPDPREFDQMGEGTPMPQPFTRPGGGGDAQFLAEAQRIDPLKAFSLRQSMAKDSPFGKVDLDKFTPESIKAFIATGGKDFSVLVPRVKMEAVNTGGATQFINPYAPPSQPIKHGLSPADQQRLPLERANFGLSLARARDEGISGLPGVPGGGQFVTGGTPGAAPVAGPRFAPAPTPAALPAPSAPGMSPKKERELAAEKAKSLPDDLRSFEASTSALDSLLQSALGLKQHPGVAGITGGMGIFPNAPMSNASAAAADLETLKSKVMLNALQTMRDASKTGGALGSVTERELGYLMNSIASLDTKQSTKDFRAQLGKIEAYANATKKRLENALKREYGDGVFQRRSEASDPLGIRGQ